MTGRLNFDISASGSPTTITLGQLLVLDPSADQIDSRNGPVSTITWDNSGSNAVLNYQAGGELLLQHNHVLNDTLEVYRDSSGQVRLSRLISGPGGLILKGGGQEFVLGETGTANTFLGGVCVEGNTRLDMRKHAAMGTGALTFTVGSTASTVMTPRGSWSGAFANDIVVDGIGRIREESSGTARTFSGDISGNGSLTIEHKASNWLFTGAHTGNGSLTTQATGTVTFSGATDYDGGISIGTGSTLKYDSLVNQEVTGTISGGGALVKAGAGMLTLIPGGNPYNGQPNTFTGGATLEAGTLRVAAKGTDALGTGSFTIQGGTIELAANNIQTMNNSHYNLDGDFSVVCNGGHTLKLATGNVTLGATNTVTLVDGWTTARLEINGTIDDGGYGYGLIKDGAGTKGKGTLTLRGTNSTYTGKTIVLNGTLAAMTIENEGVASSLGAPTGANATIDLYGGASLRAGRPSGNSNTTDRVINLAGAGGTTKIYIEDNDTTLTLNSDLTATGTGAKTLVLGVKGDRPEMILNGAIPDVSDGSPLSLQVNVEGNQQKKGITLNGVNTYTGDTTVNNGSGSIIWFGLTLGDDAGLLFDIGPSGVNNRILGDGIVDLNGDFTFDLTGAGTTGGDWWQIVDTSGGLIANYGSTFTVTGFTDAGGDLWTLNSGGVNYQFSEPTGVLSVLAGVIPEPATIAVWSLLGLCWAGVSVWRRRRKGGRSS